jgi:endonuclease YncB( thermonuclease family)
MWLGLLGGWLAAGGLAWVEQVRRDPPEFAASADLLSARFGFCPEGDSPDCVVDGDTFWFKGAKYRIADIDAPETHGPACAEEGALGARATRRLRALLDAGPFSLARGDRDTDFYGRALRIVVRDGQSIGDMLVAEGLARRWDGRRHPWCGKAVSGS